MVALTQATLNGGTLAWRDTGNTADPAIVLLHGFPFDSTMWTAQLETPPAGWRVIAPDFRGFGGSRPMPATNRLDMSLLAEDVAALLGHLRIHSAVVCGLSMGGYVALALLAHAPALVRALVLCDTRAEADTADARDGRLQNAQTVTQSGTAALMRGMLPKLISRFTMQSRPSITEDVRSKLAEAQPDAVSAALRGMAARLDSTALLRALDMPVQVIVGADDEITPAGEVQLMTRSIRGGRIETVLDAGHLPNIEQPAEFNRILSAFLDTLA